MSHRPAIDPSVTLYQALCSVVEQAPEKDALVLGRPAIPIAGSASE